MQHVAAFKAAVIERVRALRAATVSATISVKQVVLGAVAEVKDKGIRNFAAEALTTALALAGTVAALTLERAQHGADETKQLYFVARRGAQASGERTAAKAKDLYSATCELVVQDSFKATAAGAATGAVTLGAGGAAAGLAMGGVLGATLGLLAAPLTFGLSIPVGAVIGGGAGAVMGTAAGSAAGLVSGCVAGYGMHRKRDDITALSAAVHGRAERGVADARLLAITSVKRARDSVASARARLSGAEAAASL